MTQSGERDGVRGAPRPDRCLRLGAVSFLNARPLTLALEAGRSASAMGPAFDLAYGLPSSCAADLRDGRIDAGLIPSIEYAVSDDPYAIVPGVGIGCRGDVLTVRLFYRGDLAAVRTVAVDTSSRTSVALLRILLAERHGLRPELIPAAPDLDAMLHRADAALLIGDPVLPLVEAESRESERWDAVAGRASLDLGAEWLELTGLPFVFAFWAGRPDAMHAAAVRRLQDARVEGEGRVAEIAATFQHERAGSAGFYEHYLREHIRYDLGEDELEGVREFYRLARVHGIIEAEPELRFYCAGAPDGETQ